MYLAHKSNIVQTFSDSEWKCRMKAKGMCTSEYWDWIKTISTQNDMGDNVITYPEEDFTLVELSDENIHDRFAQLAEYRNHMREPDEAKVYNIKWSDEKTKVTVDGLEIETHFTGDDDAKDARLLVEEWVRIRRERTRLITETDWMANSDVTLSAAWKTYRQKLRDLPDNQSSKTSFADIDWPNKPSS